MTAYRACEASPDCFHSVCVECDRMIRTKMQKAGDHPGTFTGVLRTSTCRRCSERDGRPLVKQPRPDNCIDCKKPLRSATQSPEDYPGTVIHAGRGRCDYCVWKFKQEQAGLEISTIRGLNAKQARLKAFGVWTPVPSHFEPLSDEVVERIAETDGGFREYLRRRRRDRVPAEGRQYYMKSDEPFTKTLPVFAQAIGAR